MARSRTIPRRAFSIGLFGALFAGGVRPASAGTVEYRVIVHPNLPDRLDRSFVADAFLKKKTRWPNDQLIRVVDQKTSAQVRRAFSEGVLRRSVEAVRSYWQQRIFSGRDVPPPELDSDEAVVKYVARNPGAMGYVAVGVATHGVKIVVLD